MWSMRWIGAGMMAAACVWSVGCKGTPHRVGGAGWQDTQVREVEAVLDALHVEASRADFGAYFALFTDDAVFLGTDASERWTVEEFKRYTRPHFESGQGWTYVPLERHVTLDEEGRVAWFDERLSNENYGQCRGTGVVVREPLGAWRIAQYSLTKLVPNQRMEAVMEAIGGAEGGR